MLQFLARRQGQYWPFPVGQGQKSESRRDNFGPLPLVAGGEEFTVQSEQQTVERLAESSPIRNPQSKIQNDCPRDQIWG